MKVFFAPDFGSVRLLGVYDQSGTPRCSGPGVSGLGFRVGAGGGGGGIKLRRMVAYHYVRIQLHS